MAGLPVLTTMQPIVGIDFHKSIPPPPPVGPLMTPHVVAWFSGLSQKENFLWSVASTSKASSPESGCLKPTQVGSGHACGRTHDAGPHPGHIWPNVLLPLIMLGSGSKAEFGSGTVKVAVSHVAGDSVDLGVNLAYFMNLNLDCADFPLPPTPTGMCFTTSYNVTAGFTTSDFLRGLVQMLFDSVLTWVVGLACAEIGAVLSGVVGQVMGQNGLLAMGAAFNDAKAIKTASSIMSDGAGYFASNGRLFVEGWKFTCTAAKYAFKNDATGMTIGIGTTLEGIYGIGTPVGYAPRDAPVGGYAPSSPSSKTSTIIDGLFR
jgi:hypothetical protein